ARDLLDEVVRDRDVGALHRWLREQDVALDRAAGEPEALEDVYRLVARDVDAEHFPHEPVGHADQGAWPRTRVPVDGAGELRAGVIAQEGDGSRERDRHEVRAELPCEASRRGAPGRATHVEPCRGAADSARLERSATERVLRR